MGLADVPAGDTAISHGSGTTVPRAADWDGDGKVDLIVGAEGNVWFYRNMGTATEPRFAPGVKVQTEGRDIQCGTGRVAIALADMNRDSKPDLIAIAENDRKCPVLSQYIGRRRAGVRRGDRSEDDGGR